MMDNCLGYACPTTIPAEDGESGTEIEWVSVYREDDSCSSVTCGVVVGVALSAVCVWGVITLLPHEASVEELYATQRQAG